MHSSYASRQQPLNKYSIAFARFSKRREWISHFLWFSYFTSDIASKGLSEDENTDENIFKRNMKIPDELWRSLPQSQNAWKIWRSRTENWSRVNVLASDIANLESYLRNITRICFESNPNALLGYATFQDGLNSKRSKRTEKLTNQGVRFCTEDSWSKRAHSMEELLSVPEYYFPKETIEILDTARQKRNKAAHFLNESSYFSEFNDFSDDLTKSLESNVFPQISLEYLKNYLDTTYRLTEKLDSFLLKRHIGCYEPLDFACTWIRENQKKTITWATEYNKNIQTLPHIRPIRKKEAKKITKYILTQVI